jgi:hypothetical protein
LTVEAEAARDGDELRKHILGRLVETMYKRCKLYNMPMPDNLQRMAAEAGRVRGGCFGGVLPVG